MNKLHWSIVRPLVTLLFACALVAGFWTGKIAPDVFVPIAAGCITWWFSQRDATKNDK